MSHSLPMANDDDTEIQRYKNSRRMSSTPVILTIREAIIYKKRATVNMNPYQKALTSVIRNKLKTTILFFLTFVLGVLMAMMLLTHHASTQAQQNVINHMQPQAIAGRDWTAIMDFRIASDDTFVPWPPIVPPLTIELINEIVSLPYVESYDYFIERQLFSLELERVIVEFEGDTIEMRPESIITDLGVFYDVRGVQTPEFADIEQNVIEIISGRTFTSDEMEHSLPVALISEELARQNQLAVGSVISLRSAVFHPNHVYDIRDFTEENALGSLFYDIEIIGIFHVAADVTSPHVHISTNRVVLEELYNRIVVPNGFMTQVDEETSRLAAATGFYAILSELEEVVSGGLTHEKAGIYARLYSTTEHHFRQVETFFTLSHPHDLIPFIESVEPLLPEYYTVHFADNNFQAILHAFESLEHISSLLLYITIGAIILIFSLLITLYMRNRKHEIDIYLAVGVRKKQIGLQMICETLMVSVPALILSLLVGNVVGNRIAENMLINDLLRIEEMDGQNIAFDLFFRSGFGDRKQLTVNTLLQSYDNALTFGLSLLFLAVAIMTILVSILLPLAYALRQNPKKVMM